ncbi:ABC transporter ATP-binding protein [Siphonobacter curvatus]|uniref:ABC transporter n=1 Tax=Siphonobacter curvatus TaxID=2094562 RepID=A0A2S7IT47_9BACT|nr:ATP-binding cassette domain-containing protein [Siphonobacter curvatus]PQA60849.1 ABC transporter [Siphonobacter curvatus]
MLQVKNYRKAYHGRTILQVPDWQLLPGIHWIRGSNGSGKSTFFRSIAGMLPCQGEIWLNNQYEVSRHSVPYRMRVNYAEAEPLYPEYLSAFDLISFVGKAKQSPAGQVDSLIDTLEIREFWKQPVGTYSSGMLKKTSLVLGFLGQPELIMLDEPLITIDDRAVANVCSLIATYHQRGVSFLLSSHQDFRLTELALDSSYRIQNHTLVETPA